MSKEYSQKTCNLKDIAYTLNDVINEFPEDTKLDTKLIPFENMNMVAILYREAEDGEDSGDGGEGTGTTLVYFEGTLNNNDSSISPTTDWNYTSGEVVDMIFNQKSPVVFGVYLTDSLNRKVFYNMTPAWVISDGTTFGVSCKFVDDLPNQDHYRILADGTVELDE